MVVDSTLVNTAARKARRSTVDFSLNGYDSATSVKRKRNQCNGADPLGITVNELLLIYWRFTKYNYVKEGEPTKELACVRDAIRPLK